MSDTVLNEHIKVDIDLNGVATLPDDGTRRMVLFAIERILSPDEVEAMRRSWEREFMGWNEPPKFIIIDGAGAEHVVVMEKPSEGEGG